MCAMLINIVSSACNEDNEEREEALALLCRSFHKHAVLRERREFVRILHSNTKGQPRSKIKSSKKEREKWEIAPGDPRLDSRDIDPTAADRITISHVDTLLVVRPKR